VAKLETLKANIDHLGTMYEFLIKLKSQWEEIEKKTAVLETEIEELEKVASVERPENCEGMLGYETESLGGGIVGYYYDNENFGGSPKMHVDHGIDFFVNNEPPIKDINPENFSIRWQGFLRVPKSS